MLGYKKIKIEITNSPEKYEEENISYQTYGTQVKAVLRKKAYSF